MDTSQLVYLLPDVRLALGAAGALLLVVALLGPLVQRLR